MYCRPSTRWLTSPRCSNRTSMVATVVSASRRPVSAPCTSVTDASSRDQSTCMTVSWDAVRRGGGADGFRGTPEYYTSRRRTASQAARAALRLAQHLRQRVGERLHLCPRVGTIVIDVLGDVSSDRELGVAATVDAVVHLSDSLRSSNRWPSPAGARQFPAPDFRKSSSGLSAANPHRPGPRNRRGLWVGRR